jgi:hypothetical protein
MSTRFACRLKNSVRSAVDLATEIVRLDVDHRDAIEVVHVRGNHALDVDV